MKITPLGGAPSVDIGSASTSRTNPEAISRAKAIAEGRDPGIRMSESDTPIDPQVARIQKRSIKMTTQVSPDRQPEENLDQTTGSVIPNTIEQVSEVEATKPLSPQFAALAKQRRALQQERAAFERLKAEGQSQPGTNSPASIDRAKLLEDPLSVLREAGVLNDSFYNSLTEELLNGQTNPAASQIATLKAEIESLKSGIDSKFTERDSQAEEQVKAEIKREAKQLVSSGDEYKYTRAMGKSDDVARLVHENWKKTGEVLETTEALSLIEAECKKDWDNLQSRLGITQVQAPASNANQNRTQGMRTLTNRDTARPSPSRRERMIAAFEGRLK